ncbi:hypothetical protein HDV05_003353 [Chytridiales sp. JEL 0842]|nr:hypothetical protein HDV05_003353 [Chytridiales sp. JEL 0842]
MTKNTVDRSPERSPSPKRSKVEPEGFMFGKHRAKTLKHLEGEKGALYLKGGSISSRRWTDTEISLRQESYFYYLTGVNEPDAHLIVSLKSGDSTLLVPRYDDDHVLWCGKPPSTEQLKKQFGFTSVRFSDELKSVLEAATDGTNTVHVLDGEQVNDLKEFKLTVVDKKLRTAITEARVIKTPEEIELMRKAAKISGEAHIALMKATKAGTCKTEGELHALFTYECAKRGAPVQAYGAIVAGGRNGATLHYNSNHQSMPSNPHDLMLIDAGCEYKLYASDITRCFPVGGKFEGEWKVTYQIVLDMQMAVLKALKPGVKWEEMHRLAERVACEGLLKAKIIKGTTEELLKNHIPALFFPHGLGHLLGIDVHDCGGYPSGVERIPEPGIRYLRMRRDLVAGMVVTVEPGLYFVDPILDKALVDPKLKPFLNADLIETYRQKVGGVRIEDDVVITASGIDNLTGWVPKEIKDIEAIMG